MPSRRAPPLTGGHATRLRLLLVVSCMTPALAWTCQPDLPAPIASYELQGSTARRLQLKVSSNQATLADAKGTLWTGPAAPRSRTLLAADDSWVAYMVNEWDLVVDFIPTTRGATGKRADLFVQLTAAE